MEKVVKIIRRGQDDSNINYWITLTPLQRLENLFTIRKEVNERLYPDHSGRVEKVVHIVKKSSS